MKKFKIPGLLKNYKKQNIKNLANMLVKNSTTFIKNTNKKFVNAFNKIGTITKNTFTAAKSRISKLPKASLIAVTVLAIITFGTTAYFSGIINTFNRVQDPYVEVNIEPKITTPPSVIPSDPEVVGTPSFPEVEENNMTMVEEGQASENNVTLEQVDQNNLSENDMLAEKTNINLIKPAEGEVIREFGFNYSKTFNDYRFHDGIDIGVAAGSEVVAAGPGKVVNVTHTDMEKYTVVINHGSYLETIYKHVGEIEVQKGDTVKEGQKIGIITEPGLWDEDTGPHLHFSITYRGNKVNPEKYLGEL